MLTRSLLNPHSAREPARFPLLEKGFRPFFLLGALFAACAVPLWLCALWGKFQPGGDLGAMQWHAHEMLFGFSSAIIAGFLLTAVANWSGRETLTGAPLGTLAVLWVLARGALFFAARLPRVLPALLDIAFLPAVALACALPLLRAKSRRNYGFVGLLLALSAANAAAHYFALRGDLASVRLAHRFALDLIVIMMVAMTGRIVPMFTRNATRLPWLRALPWLERASLAAVILFALSDLLPSSLPSAVFAALAALLLLARLRFWGSLHTLGTPLLWILHAGSLFLPLGLALRAAATLTDTVPAGSAVHALTAGALGSLTLGMMARVSLGHTGRTLTPARSVTVAFFCLITAALLRVGAPFLPSAFYLRLLSAAAVAWSAAFGLFLVAYWKILFAPRADAR
jgi:uncharacterized protein involved in response to NO